jgi:hypothetical protein
MKKGIRVGTVFKTGTSCLCFLCASFFLAPSCNVVNKATCNAYFSDTVNEICTVVNVMMMIVLESDTIYYIIL